MTTITRAGGLSIKIPDGFLLAESTETDHAARKAERHGPRTLSPEEVMPPLIEALQSQDLQLVDSLTLNTTPEVENMVRKARPVQRTIDITSEKISSEEGMVVLIEQDGVYSWHLPDTVSDSTVRHRGGPGQRQVEFSITLGRPAENMKQFRKRGFVSDFIVREVRAYILKFVVEWGTKRLMRYLERNVQKGLIHMNHINPSRWSRFDKLGQLEFPGNRPARILLFIHGTFSSTLGSYGALGGTEEGKELLQTAQDCYDAVIGFDHPTLSLSPEENARELLDALKSYPWSMPPHLDIVTYSRGGLVYRALAEILLPQDTWHPRIDRVIFVAVPNAGTHLAEPDNWHTLLDLYTNLAAAAAKVISKIPYFSIAAKIFNELIQGLGALGKYLASQAVTKGDVPGLAAMEPDGSFITEINRFQKNQPAADTTFYCAITSEFEAKLFNDEVLPKEFPKRLAITAVDKIADQLFGVANDLVVDTPSMINIDQSAGKYIKEHFYFGKNSLVYHTVYFIQPSVAHALTRWLNLDKKESDGLRSVSGDWVSPGAVSSPVLSPEIKTDVLVTSSTENMETLQNDLENNPEAEFVVVQQPKNGSLFNYSYHRSEIEKHVKSLDGGETVFDGLKLHKRKASETHSPIYWDRSIRNSPMGASVILDDDKPIGIIPETDYTERAYSNLNKETLSRNPEEQIDSKAEQASAVIQCHFYAEMPNAVRLGADTSLLVSVSREMIEAVANRAAASGTASIDPDRKIILDARGRENFIIVGSARAEIEPPEPGEQSDIYFTVRSTDPDEGEVWITARQGQFPLVTLKIRVKIVMSQPEIVSPISVTATTDEPLILPPELSQLRIFERRNGEEISYEYDLDIPGIIFDRFESPSIRIDRGEYVRKLYSEIEERWLGAQQDTEAFSQEMREMGGSLFEQLFPLKLQQALWENRDSVKHIQVISTEPFIPWEIVHLKEPGQPLPDESHFLAQLGVVRWLHGSYYPSEVQIRKDRARYVIPDYPHPDDKLPSTADEKKYLEEKFQARPVEPHSLPVRHLLRGPGSFDLFHFAGHGIAEQENIVNSQIQLEGRIEGSRVISEYLSSTAVEQQSRLQDAEGNRPMVVLNACQTGNIGFRLTGMGGFASAFLSRGAGIFVSTLWSVSDQPAKDFVIKLYDELLGDAKLSDAVISAREAARSAGDASWLSYVVYGHPDAHLVLNDT